MDENGPFPDDDRYYLPIKMIWIGNCPVRYVKSPEGIWMALKMGVIASLSWEMMMLCRRWNEVDPEIYVYQGAIFVFFFVVMAELRYV